MYVNIVSVFNETTHDFYTNRLCFRCITTETHMISTNIVSVFNEKHLISNQIVSVFYD